MKRETARTIALVLALIGVCDSAWLLFHHLEVRSQLATGPSFCSVNAYLDCDAVAKSKFSEVFGFPIAALGLFYYLVMITFLGRARQSEADGTPENAAFAWSALGLGVALFEFGVSIFVIGALCLMCTVLYAVNLLLFFVTGSAAPRKFGALIGDAWKGLRRYGTRIFLGKGEGILLLAVLLGGALASPWLVSRYILPAVYPPKQERVHEESLSPRELWQKAAPQPVPVNPVTDFTRGDPASGRTLVVFSDLECPHCRRAAEVLERVRHDIPFFLVFKNFPLGRSCNRLVADDIHPHACRLALIGRCAGQRSPDLFWMWHDAVFHLEEVSAASIEKLRADLALDDPAFEQCLTDGVQQGQIEKDVSDGIALRITGTPALFLNGRRVPGIDEAFVREILSEVGASKRP